MSILDPEFSDFKEAEGYLSAGLPKGAEVIRPYQGLGEWKYLLIFDGDYYCEEIGRANLENLQNGCALTLTPQQGKDEYEIFPLTAEEVGYEPFTGSMNEEEFVLQGNRSTIVPGSFVQMDGCQYSYGSITAEAGLTGNLILIRP